MRTTIPLPTTPRALRLIRARSTYRRFAHLARLLDQHASTESLLRALHEQDERDGYYRSTKMADWGDQALRMLLQDRENNDTPQGRDAQWLAHGGQWCPHCRAQGENIGTSNADMGFTTYTETWSCSRCNAQWLRMYRLMPAITTRAPDPCDACHNACPAPLYARLMPPDHRACEEPGCHAAGPTDRMERVLGQWFCPHHAGIALKAAVKTGPLAKPDAAACARLGIRTRRPGPIPLRAR